MNIVDQVSQDDIKEINAKRILRVFAERRELTNLEIANETGFSIPTIASNVKVLLNDGIVRIKGYNPSKRGRKAAINQFDPDSRVVFGVDFSSNHIQNTGMIRFILVNLDVNIVHEESFNFNEYKNIEEIMHHLQKRFVDILKSKEIENKQVLGVSISLPGIVNEEDKLLEIDPNLNTNLGINEIDFKIYTKLFPFPLYIENEANTAALAEIKRGNKHEDTNLLYLAVNRGISASIVINGRIYKGGNKRSGLVGHLHYKESEQLCTCGRNGCWELFAATGALLRNYLDLTGNPLDNTNDFYKKLVKGEPEAFKVWNEYLSDLTSGIINLSITLDPVRIIIGGEISLFEKFLLFPLQEEVKTHSFIRKNVDFIEIGRYKNDASLLGAAILPINMFFNSKNSIYLYHNSI